MARDGPKGRPQVTSSTGGPGRLAKRPTSIAATVWPARSASARGRAETARRSEARARFIYETAIEHGVHVAIVPSPLGEISVSVWAPNASSPELQAAAERSFAGAVKTNIGAVRRYADSLRARPRNLGN